MSTRSLGDLVVERGLASREVVQQALARQVEQARGGVFKRLGEVLVEEGALRAEQVTELLKLQGKEIRFCPLCFAQYNVEQLADSRSTTCARCGQALAVPTKLSGLQVEDDLSPRRSDGAKALALASGERGDSERLRGLGESDRRRFGTYEILGEISRGGMGVVYKARQPDLERVVALKVILGSTAGSASGGEEAVRRFRREARAVSRLRHPHIVAVHDVGVIDGINYFSMDFIEGLTLDRAVTTEGLTHRQIAGIFEKVADAVHYAHEQGVVHRDLKPRNIIVDRRGYPTVIDFGIARVEKSLESGEHSSLTKAGEIIGSPAFLAPEYITGDVPDYDRSCDVWSLGACLYAALTGRAPHADQDTIRIIRAAATAEAPPIRSLARNVDRELARIVMTAVARDRQNRYRTAKELGDDLHRWLAGEEIEGRSSRLALWWQRVRPKVAMATGLAASIALVWSTGYYANELTRLKGEREEGAPSELLHERLDVKSIKLGEALIKAGDYLAAEHELSDTLGAVNPARRAEVLRLRAKARRALGKEDAAAQDERDAKARQ